MVRALSNRNWTRTTDTEEQLRVYYWCLHYGLTTYKEWQVGDYSLDIYLPELKLGIEIDGHTHSRKRDAKRDANIKRRYGIEVVRLKNKETKSVTRLYEILDSYTGEADED